MGNISMNIEGQLNSMSFPKRKILWPIFEAVVNSIQSIDESENKESGKITILAHREGTNQMNLAGNQEDASFDWFSIEDNGNGFNEQNYKSFCEAYSTLKLKKGCKGIGRFLWLKLFTNVSISSNYKQDGVWYQRTFKFNDVNAVHSNVKTIISTESPKSTCFRTFVKLEYIRNEYKDRMTKSLDFIAQSIVEHCLLYFISPTCPSIVLKDSDGKIIDLNNVYNNTIRISSQTFQFSIKENKFVLHNMKKFNGNEEHELHLCANNREVKSVKIKKYIPNLQSKLKAPSGDESFYYQGYVISEYLDTIVTPDRTKFNFVDEEDTLFDDISELEIIDKVISGIEAYLSDALSDVAKAKKERIDRFVTNEKPQYKYLLARRPEIYDSIPANAQNETIELLLHKETQKWEIELSRQSKQIEQKIHDSKSLPENFQDSVDEWCRQLTEISSASLTEYVIRRKGILILLQEGIRRQENEKFNKESYIHNLIYPMKMTSDEMPYESHNLWLIDERLSYCLYISSDCELEQRKERPDILLLDNPVAVAEETTGEVYNSIVIFELKRPMRDDYTLSDNPVTQLLGYVKKLRSNKAKDKNGRAIVTHSETQFYLYAICDITPSLESVLDQQSYRKTPDGLGRYFYHEIFHAYIEVIPFNKLVCDAEKRNRILFDKLLSPNVAMIFKRNLMNK